MCRCYYDIRKSSYKGDYDQIELFEVFDRLVEQLQTTVTSYIGKDSEDNIPWRNSQTYDYCSMPRSKVVVDYVHGGEETDNIFLD